MGWSSSHNNEPMTPLMSRWRRARLPRALAACSAREDAAVGRHGAGAAARCRRRPSQVAARDPTIWRNLAQSGGSHRLRIERVESGGICRPPREGVAATQRRQVRVVHVLFGQLHPAVAVHLGVVPRLVPTRAAQSLVRLAAQLRRDQRPSLRGERMVCLHLRRVQAT